MGKLNFDTNSLGALGGGMLILIGLVVLAMVAACRCFDGLGGLPGFRKAAGQLGLAVILEAVFYGVLGVAMLILSEGRTDPGEIKFALIVLLTLVIWQIVLVAQAIKNLLGCLDQR